MRSILRRDSVANDNSYSTIAPEARGAAETVARSEKRQVSTSKILLDLAVRGFDGVVPWVAQPAPANNLATAWLIGWPVASS